MLLLLLLAKFVSFFVTVVSTVNGVFILLLLKVIRILTAAAIPSNSSSACGYRHIGLTGVATASVTAVIPQDTVTVTVLTVSTVNICVTVTAKHVL